MYEIDSLDGTIKLGNQYDLNTTSIEFDVSTWIEAFPGCNLLIEFMPFNSLGAFIASGVSLNETTLTWVVGTDITRFSGKGTFIIKGYVDYTLVKHTPMIRYTIGAGYENVTELTDPIEDYLARIDGAVNAAYGAAEKTEGPSGASIVSADFDGNDIVFTKDDTPATTVTLADAVTTLKGLSAYDSAVLGGYTGQDEGLFYTALAELVADWQGKQ